MMESDKRSTLPRGDFNLQATDVEACRICLSTDNKLYSLKDTNLRSCLESIGGFPNLCEGLPNYVCYECAPTLIKCNKLIEKSQKARATLEDIFEKNGQITKPLIKSQNRTQLNLNSSLDSYLLLNYYYIKYDDDNNKSEIIQTKLNPNIKIETKKEDEEIGVETKMEDALAETVKESLYLRKTKEENSEVPMQDDSVEEIKKDVSVVELSDDDETKDVGRCSSNREEIEKRNKRMMVQEIFHKLKPFKRPKRASRGQQSETISEQESVPMSKMEYHEIKEYFKIVGKKTEVLLDVIDKTQKQTGIGFTCNVCFKSFGNAALLQEHSYHHVSSSHGKVECPVCLLCFSDNAEMEVHKKRVHAREYRCKFCPAVFEDLDEAKAHKNSLCNETVSFPANDPPRATDNGKNSGPPVQEAQTDRLRSSMETSSSPEPAKQRSWYPKNWLNE